MRIRSHYRKVKRGRVVVRSHVRKHNVSLPQLKERVRQEREYLNTEIPSISALLEDMHNTNLANTRLKVRQWASKPENKAKKAEYARRWYSNPANKAKQAEYYRQYYSNPEIKAKRAEYYRQLYFNPENKAKRAEYARRWYSKPENKAKQAEYHRQWRKRHEN